MNVPAKCYLGIFKSEYGVDVDVYGSEADAVHGLALAALENLDDLLDDEYEGEAKDARRLMVAAYRAGKPEEVVRLYNENTEYGEMEVREVDMVNAIVSPTPLTEDELNELEDEDDGEEDDDDGEEDDDGGELCPECGCVLKETEGELCASCEGEDHPHYGRAGAALIADGEYEYRGTTIRPAPGDGYTLTGHDRYDTLNEALDAVDEEMGCMEDEDDDHPNQCTQCQQWFTDDDYIRYYDKCKGCAESLD